MPLRETLEYYSKGEVSTLPDSFPINSWPPMLRILAILREERVYDAVGVSSMRNDLL